MKEYFNERHKDLDYFALLVNGDSKEKHQMIDFILKDKEYISRGVACATFFCGYSSYSQKCRLLNAEWATEKNLNQLVDDLLYTKRNSLNYYRNIDRDLELIAKKREYLKRLVKIASIEDISTYCSIQ